MAPHKSAAFRKSEFCSGTTVWPTCSFCSTCCATGIPRSVFPHRRDLLGQPPGSSSSSGPLNALMEGQPWGLTSAKRGKNHRLQDLLHVHDTNSCLSRFVIVLNSCTCRLLQSFSGFCGRWPAAQSAPASSCTGFQFSEGGWQLALGVLRWGVRFFLAFSASIGNSTESLALWKMWCDRYASYFWLLTSAVLPLVFGCSILNFNVGYQWLLNISNTGYNILR